MLAVLTVVAVAVSGGPARPAAAGAATAAATSASSGLLLDSQTPWVTPSAPVFTVAVSPGPSAGSPAQLSLVITIYGRLTSRSVLEQMIASGPGSASALDRTGPLAVSGLTAEGDGWQVPVTIATAATTDRPPTSLDLRCSPGYCSGVYPVEITLERSGTPIGQLTTFLTYAEEAGAEPLSVAWVVPFATPPATRSAAARAQVDDLSQLGLALADHPTVPVTVAIEPRTLADLAGRPGEGARTAQLLAALSTEPSVHQFLDEPYVPIDANALAGAGLTGELQAQMIRGDAIFTINHVVPAPGPTTWVASGVVGSAFGRAVGPLKVGQVVVPVADLAATQGGGTPTLGQPFDLVLGRGQSVVAAAADPSLTAHFAAAARDPVLAANQLLADLALVHYEAPGSSEAPRGLVAVPPAGWQPDAAFDQTLLAGLTANPNVRPVTLSTFFTTVPVGGNGWSATRQLAVSGAGPVLPAPLAQSMASGRLRLSDFDGTVSGAEPLLGQLDDDLLSSEAADLRTSQQAAGVAGFERALSHQLSLVQLGTEHTITLTSRTATIPVTILSDAPYTVHGTLTLASDKLQFPSGASQQVVIDHPTTAVRFVVTARTSGDLPLTVTFTSPSGTLVIFHTVLTVRSTATSLAGLLLTLAALAVLIGWWARTWRARRRARRRGGHGDDEEPVPAEAGELTHR